MNNAPISLKAPPPAGLGSEGHTKVLSGTKKERNHWTFFVVKGILLRVNEFIGELYHPNLQLILTYCILLCVLTTIMPASGSTHIPTYA